MAKQLVVLVHDKPVRLLHGEPVGLGLGTIAQLVPFHHSTSVSNSVSRGPSVWPNHPTAKQLVVLVHDTPRRTLDGTPDGLGLETIAQLAPFHCSIRVTMPYELLSESPTAKQLVVLAHD